MLDQTLEDDEKELLTILTPDHAGPCPRVRVSGGTFREHACLMSGSRSLEASGTAGESEAV
eukprot:6288212-Prymnesium_polylepis.1